MRDINKLSFVPPWLIESYPEQKYIAYTKLVEGLRAKSNRIELNIPYDSFTMTMLYYDAYNSDPLLYDVDIPEFEPADGKTIVHARYRDQINGQDIEDIREAVQQRADELYGVMGLDLCRTSLEKELAVNEWLVRNCKWCDEGDFRYRHSVLGILLDNKGVCLSFAQATALMLQYSKVPCYVVVGSLKKTGERRNYQGYRSVDVTRSILGGACGDCICNDWGGCKTPAVDSDSRNGRVRTWEDFIGTRPGTHAWNYVQLTGGNRHLDVTFNTGSKKPLAWTKVKHDYFNLTTSRIEIDRKITFGPKGWGE